MKVYLNIYTPVAERKWMQAIQEEQVCSKMLIKVRTSHGNSSIQLRIRSGLSSIYFEKSSKDMMQTK